MESEVAWRRVVSEGEESRSVLQEGRDGARAAYLGAVGCFAGQVVDAALAPAADGGQPEWDAAGVAEEVVEYGIEHAAAAAETAALGEAAVDVVVAAAVAAVAAAVKEEATGFSSFAWRPPFPTS